MEAKEQTKYIVQQFLQTLSARNLNSLGTLLADNVDWYIPGNSKIAPWLGRRNTKREVLECLEQLWNNTKPISAQIDNILIEGNFAVIIGAFSTLMLQTGNVVDSIFSIHITIDKNKIIKYRLLEDSHAVVEALQNQ